VAGKMSILRLMLLIAVACGVTGMHTLGHAAADQHFTGPDHGTMAVTATAYEQSREGSTTALVADPNGDRPGGMHMSPFAVCLAVLAALGLSVLIMATLTSTGSAFRAPQPRLAVAVGSRGPPWSAVGLRIARLSVLRT
jgi:hypothetical protein